MWDLFEEAYNNLEINLVQHVENKYKHSIKIEKSKTILMHDFSQKDDITLQYLLKFLIKKIGLRGHITKNKQILLSKQVNIESLKLLLEQFYIVYIRCKFCHNDDTKLLNANVVCSACGKSYDARIQ